LIDRSPAACAPVGGAVEISDVRVKLLDEPEDKLRGFCTITLANQFVVRDVQIIEGSGGYFIAMPSRKLTERCHKCRCKNHLRAKFCNDCGGRLDPSRAEHNAGGRIRLHADVAHPISQECRDALQSAVIAAFEAALERAASGEEPADDGHFVDAGPD
jgi:stage V sporulation protein G